MLHSLFFSADSRTSKLLFCERLVDLMKPTSTRRTVCLSTFRCSSSFSRCWRRHLNHHWLPSCIRVQRSASMSTSILSQAAARWMQKQATRSGGYLTQNDVKRILEEITWWEDRLVQHESTTFSSLDSRLSARVHVVLRKNNRNRSLFSPCSPSSVGCLLFSGNDWIWPETKRRSMYSSKFDTCGQGTYFRVLG